MDQIAVAVLQRIGEDVITAALGIGIACIGVIALRVEDRQLAESALDHCANGRRIVQVCIGITRCNSDYYRTVRTLGVRAARRIRCANTGHDITGRRAVGSSRNEVRVRPSDRRIVDDGDREGLGI